VQAAFIAEEAAQCGYCSNGWMMTAVAALEQDPVRSDAEIRQMLTGLKCRCGSHMAIMRAVRRAADAMALGQPVAGTHIHDYQNGEV
jgi:aerobic-type carbon monoxide dehydrogenase small subunit (CoxS/CutS family)